MYNKFVSSIHHRLCCTCSAAAFEANRNPILLNFLSLSHPEDTGAYCKTDSDNRLACHAGLAFVIEECLIGIGEAGHAGLRWRIFSAGKETGY